ncbi:hypothetical protein [Gordonia sp. NB41Y]|uniref:hypothetical protein n=1 Tax=Gordonia sp. NB41Y TaxID=875808 RepID=UPI0006B187A0|nr:hypothetical protein [Gordonia sp. NB41Y]EMP13323.2 membrane protein [Gordonia sp. NB41Y]WLP92757.1 hypothetical protein Q9K23_11310 [Gordonia sp. NB41Y]
MNTELTASPVLWAIVGCEIGFWVLLLAGLSARYLLHRRRLSTALLVAVPAVDIALVVAVVLDLAGGAQVTSVHRLAGIYLGVTVAFGNSVIGWADARFAHRFAGAPAPSKPPRGGRAALRSEWIAFGRWLLAAAICAAVILGLSVTVADAEQAAALRQTFGILGVVTVIWLLTGPVWELFGARDDQAG